MKREVATVTKGRLVIPAKLRRKYSIREGTQLAFVEEENRLVLQPLTPEFINHQLQVTPPFGPLANYF
jgi:AbrB family looped-hinge helix DNA binding protein